MEYRATPLDEIAPRVRAARSAFASASTQPEAWRRAALLRLRDLLVERESQKGMVIGKGGALLKAVGIAVREQLPEGAYLELRVRVEPKWQQRRDRVDRVLGDDQD